MSRLIMHLCVTSLVGKCCVRAERNGLGSFVGLRRRRYGRQGDG